MKKSKAIVLIISVAFLLIAGCRKQEVSKPKQVPKQVAEKFIKLELNHKYKEAYKFDPKDVIGGYKGFVGASKRVFDNYKNYKFIRKQLKDQYVFELSNKKNKRLIIVRAIRPFNDRYYVSFGEYP